MMSVGTSVVDPYVQVSVPGPSPAMPALGPLPFGIPVLDQHCPLRPGQVHLVEAHGPWDSVRCQLVLEAYRRGLPVYQLVGGHRLDPYALARSARRAGLDPEDVLGHSLVARAFTAHQLSSLVHETLPRQVPGPALVMLMDPLDLYAGEEVDAREGRVLAREALRRFSGLVSRRGAYGVVATRGFSRRGPGEELLALGGPHVRLSHGGEGLVCDLVHERRRLVQWMVWPQARLDEYGLVVFPVESDDRDPMVFQAESAVSRKGRREGVGDGEAGRPEKAGHKLYGTGPQMGGHGEDGRQEGPVDV